MATTGVVLMALWLFAGASRWIYGLSFWVGVPGVALVANASARRDSTKSRGEGSAEA